MAKDIAYLDKEIAYLPNARAESTARNGGTLCRFFRFSSFRMDLHLSSRCSDSSQSPVIDGVLGATKHGAGRRI